MEKKNDPLEDQNLQRTQNEVLQDFVLDKKKPTKSQIAKKKKMDGFMLNLVMKIRKNVRDGFPKPEEISPEFKDDTQVSHLLSEIINLQHDDGVTMMWVRMLTPEETLEAEKNIESIKKYKVSEKQANYLCTRKKERPQGWDSSKDMTIATQNFIPQQQCVLFRGKRKPHSNILQSSVEQENESGTTIQIGYNQKHNINKDAGKKEQNIEFVKVGFIHIFRRVNFMFTQFDPYYSTALNQSKGTKRKFQERNQTVSHQSMIYNSYYNQQHSYDPTYNFAANYNYATPTLQQNYNYPYMYYVPYPYQTTTSGHEI